MLLDATLTEFLDRERVDVVCSGLEIDIDRLSSCHHDSSARCIDFGQRLPDMTQAGDCIVTKVARRTRRRNATVLFRLPIHAASNSENAVAVLNHRIEADNQM